VWTTASKPTPWHVQLRKKNRLELKRDRSCRRSAWLGRRRCGWTLVPSDAGRAFLVGVWHVCRTQLRAPSPNCGFCGFKVRVVCCYAKEVSLRRVLGPKLNAQRPAERWTTHARERHQPLVCVPHHTRAALPVALFARPRAFAACAIRAGSRTARAALADAAPTLAAAPACTEKIDLLDATDRLVSNPPHARESGCVFAATRSPCAQAAALMPTCHARDHG
jgi:hypothetical protein